jgi:hypothetical protein
MKGKLIKIKPVLVCMRFRIHRYIAAPNHAVLYGLEHGRRNYKDTKP